MKSSRLVEVPGYSGCVRTPVLALVAALCTFAAVGCGGGGNAGSTAPATPAEAETTTASSREQAPAIEGTSLEGKPLSLTDYRGQAVLINVWSSW